MGVLYMLFNVACSFLMDVHMLFIVVAYAFHNCADVAIVEHVMIMAVHMFRLHRA